MAEDGKAAFRAEMTARERAISLPERLESDELLRRRFLALGQLERAQTVLLFYPMGAEPDTRPLLDELLRLGKQVLLPRCLPHRLMEARVYDPAHLERHRFGMLEPDAACPVVEAENLDLVLVPALCYDEAGWRMGRGGGYYDRFLPRAGGNTVGLCRDELLCDAVPRDPWDRPVEQVLTETKTIAHGVRLK